MDEPMRLFDTELEGATTPAAVAPRLNTNGRTPVSPGRRRHERLPDNGQRRVKPSPMPATHRKDGGSPVSEGVTSGLQIPDGDESPRGEDPNGQPGDGSLGPRLVSINCAAKLLGVGRTTLYEQIAAGRLQVVHIGRATRVPLRAIDAFVEELVRRTS